MDIKKHSLINNVIAIVGSAFLYHITGSLWGLLPLIMLTWVESDKDKEN